MIFVPFKSRIILLIALLAIPLVYILFRLSYKKSIVAPFIAGSAYCSFENGCPIDKCVRESTCGGGGEEGEFGCAPGPSICEWKDGILKQAYYEISLDKAEQCARDFLKQNSQLYPYLKQFEIYRSSDNNASKEGAIVCTQLVSDKIRDPRDKYCLSVNFRNTSPPDAENYLYVGAQTCKPYLDLTNPIYKLNDPTLKVNSVDYSPEQAFECAKQYIVANQARYIQYKSIIDGTLGIRDNTPAPSAHVGLPPESVLKDWKFYEVRGKTSTSFPLISNTVYVYVGAHTCSVYGVEEGWFK